MKKVVVVLLSFLLLLGAVFPVGADAMAQTTPCAPGEHKVYKDIFTFINDEDCPFYERDGFYYPYSSMYEINPLYAATAVLLIDMDGTITIEFYHGPSADGGWMRIKHNGRILAEEKSGNWQSLTIPVKAGDTLEIVKSAITSGECRFSVNGSVLTAVEEAESTSSKSVVCDLCGAVVPIKDDDAAPTTPCAPGEHKVYRHIFTFINDEKAPFYERDGVYHSRNEPNSRATVTFFIIADGMLTVDFLVSGVDSYAAITHNSKSIARSDSRNWKSITISVKANDRVELTYGNFERTGGECQFRTSGTALVAAGDMEPTCTKNVVCDLCGEVVKEAAHRYADEVDADCNVCGEVREVTYTGWLSQNGAWYYYQNGVKLTNTWKKDSVGWVYLGVGGDMLTKTWVKDSVGWCYVGADGYCVTNQWVKDRTGWRYVGADGRMLTNRWVKDSVGWCYVGADGYCVTNRWVKDSVGWCYLGADGRMLTKAWVQDANGWCYVGSDGRAVTDTWVRDSVGWCYLKSSCNMAKGEWVQTNGKWYFVDSYGYMVTGKQYIGGKAYYFDIVTGELME